jgi:gamma-glutamyltranspeptidase / glutathione hydrolase
MMRSSRVLSFGRRAHKLRACLLTAALGACVHHVSARVDAVPGKRVEGTRGMVAASHPDAAAAGRAILQRGGNAVDAAVATAFALSVVDPSQTGLGGGGSATLWNRRDRRAASVDFMAASGADSMWGVLPPAGQDRAGIRGRAAAVPGSVAGLLHLLERHGTLPRDVVMAPAIALARDGFTVSPLLSRTIASSAAKLGGDSLARARFMPGGEALQPGDRLVQPELAATLELIARGGAPAFYEGDVASHLAAKVTAAGGLITERDMREYRVIDRRPLCGRVMDHTVLTAPPTLSGMTVLEALGIFERAVRTRAGTLAESPAAAVALADALRIADADRARWRGDPGAGRCPRAASPAPRSRPSAPHWWGARWTPYRPATRGRRMHRRRRRPARRSTPSLPRHGLRSTTAPRARPSRRASPRTSRSSMPTATRCR